MARVWRAVLGTHSIATSQPWHRVPCLHQILGEAWDRTPTVTPTCLGHPAEIPTQARHSNATLLISFISHSHNILPFIPPLGNICEAKTQEIRAKQDLLLKMLCCKLWLAARSLKQERTQHLSLCTNPLNTSNMETKNIPRCASSPE